MADTEMAYVATKPCGCVTLIVMESVSMAGREVARAIRAGEAVNRMSVEDVRTIPSLRCAEHPRPSKARQTPPTDPEAGREP